MSVQTEQRVIDRNYIMNRLPLPSNAVDAMIEGLHAWDANPKCDIAMHTFGEFFGYGENRICFGCAATATISNTFKIAPEDAVLTFDSNRVAKNQETSRELLQFEYAIDALRCGYVWSLFNWYYVATNNIGFKEPRIIAQKIMGSELINSINQLDLPALGSYGWKTDIEKYAELSLLLKEHGF